jgi:hypothetical protein
LTAHRYRSCIESGPRTSDHSRRAREGLSDGGWLFDHFVNAEMRKVLVSQPEERDQHEEAYRRARVAARTHFERPPSVLVTQRVYGLLWKPQLHF